MLWIALTACSGTDDKLDDTATDTDTDVPTAICTEPTAVQCVDEMILDLSLHDDKVSDGEVSSESDGADTLTYVDASAGGYNQANNNPWTYIRFEDDGTVSRIDIDDETALEDMTWHLALHRFVIRINSGDSGPSCVGAGALLGTTYEDVTAVPEGMTYLKDDFYTDDCTLVNDSSGLPGSPQVAMGGWWEYPGCVDVTGTPFLIQLDDGRVIKLVVEAYYDDMGVDCEDGSVTSAAGGFIWMRWSAL